MLGILLAFMGGLAYFFFHSDLLLDEMLYLLIIHVMFFAIMLLAIVKRRLLSELPEGQWADYRRIFLAILGCWLLEISFSFCPDYFLPVMLIPIVLSVCMDHTLALSLGIYFSVILCIFQGSAANALYCYCLLDICGVMLLPHIKGRRRREVPDIYVIYFILNMILPVLFYYITFLDINRQLLYAAAINGAFATAVIVIFYYPLTKVNLHIREESYENLLKEDYPLLQDIKKYSVAEYNHSKRVSQLAASCAKTVGANEMCCACAGFYYRLGRLEGEPEIENALRLANDHCFPQDVMAIMEEYGGKKRLPQTPESAIVHMVDTLVTKVELLDFDTMSSTWNQDMVIYQTLNELSQKGLYDASGLGINQFLKIRDHLVAEEILS
jgi:hypothetical protein